LSTRDPLSWSIPIFRVFGIQVRVHWLFPLVVAAITLRFGLARESYPEGTWIDALEVCGLWFLAVLFHEFGHCIGARYVNGDAREILLWPLGGLADTDIPANPKAHFITAISGPLVNLAFCMICMAGLYIFNGFQPPWSLFWYPFRASEGGYMPFQTWSGTSVLSCDPTGILLARFFYLNWALCLINVLLVGFPMDGGRILQSILWPRMGIRQATLVVIFSGFGCMFLVGFLGLLFNEVMVLCLAVYIYAACKVQLHELEAEVLESVSSDYSSYGYTYQEFSEPETEPRLGWFQSWKKSREEKRMLKLIQRQEADELRMDNLLEKLHREGSSALTEEEHRFMKQFSDRYKNRK